MLVLCTILCTVHCKLRVLSRVTARCSILGGPPEVQMQEQGPISCTLEAGEGWMGLTVVYGVLIGLGSREHPCALNVPRVRMFSQPP